MAPLTCFRHRRCFVLVNATLILAMIGVPAYPQHSHNASQPAWSSPAWSELQHAPWSSSPPRDSRCSSVPVCRNHVGCNIRLGPQEDRPSHALRETVFQYPSNDRLSIAWMETAILRFFHRCACAALRTRGRSFGIILLPSAVLLSGTKMIRLFQSRFSMRMR
jgi:hypothetical protein